MKRCRLIRDFVSETALLPYAIKADAKEINDNFFAHVLHDCTPIPTSMLVMTTGIAKPHRDLLQSLSSLADYIHEARMWMDQKQRNIAQCCNQTTRSASSSCARLVQYIHGEFLCLISSANRLSNGTNGEEVQAKTHAVCRTILMYLMRDKARMERVTTTLKEFNESKLSDDDKQRITDIRKAKRGRLTKIIRACKNVVQISREVDRFIAGGGGSINWLAVTMDTFTQNITGLLASCVTGGWIGNQYQRKLRTLIDRVAYTRKKLNIQFPTDADCCFGDLDDNTKWIDCRILLTRLRDEVNCMVSAVLEDTQRMINSNYLSVLSAMMKSVNDNLGQLVEYNSIRSNIRSV